MKERLKELEKQINNSKVLTFSTMNEEGYPVMRNMILAKTEGLGVFYVTTMKISDKVKHIKKNNKTGICWSNGMNNNTIYGKSSVIEDLSIKKDIWFDELKNYFSGPEDENYVVIKFESDKGVFYFDHDKEIIEF